MKVITIGHDRDLFRPSSDSAKRQRMYGKEIGELHCVVFVPGAASAPVQPLALSPEVTVYAASRRTRPGAVWRALVLVRALANTKDCVLSAQDPFEAGLVAYLVHLVTGVPFEVQEHGDFFSTPHWRRESLTNSSRYFLGLFILRRAQRVRAVSARIKRTLTRLGVAEERIYTLPVFVDTALFAHAEPDNELLALRAQKGPLFLTMARLVPQKDLTLLLRAFVRAKRAGLMRHLVIIGRGPEQKALRALAQGDVSEHVTFREWTEAPARAMRAADVYVLSSKYEGWARVLVEALAAGVPVVTTDVGCVGEVVRHEETALVVPVGDEAAFADALVRIGTDAALRTRLAQAGPGAAAGLPNLAESARRIAEAQRAMQSGSH